MLLNTLERYIGKNILSTIVVTLFTLVGLSAIIKFVEQFRVIGKGSYDIVQAMIFTLLTIPKDIETFFPMAALLGALIALGNLASRSELIVMQSSGFSRFRIGLAVMKTALPLVVVTMIMGEWGIPQTEQFARDMRYKAISGGSMLSVKNGVWAKDGNNFVYIRRITEDVKLNDIYIYTFDQQRQLKQVTHANQAVFENQKWVLKQVNRSEIGADKINTTNYIKEDWKTTLTPDKLGIASIRPTSLSITGLSNYIHFMKETGQDSKRFELTFWQKLFQPISVGVMMLLALSFIFGPLRSITAGARIVTGICVGFLFYVVNEIFGRMSVLYDIPAVLGALIPSLVFLTLTWWILNRKRD
ncbi:lipopolysaccharide export system permease protein [Bisgaardia hudsonensis]|uniref:Lipopolysaccharide export system permease protein n=1 Tax=Bisgaardia hudsonensis TaxID=109472 RepID=A0A4V2SJD4_9PAST|nr:LPS export ABC transporter permease LptG [Bisgaardia hudsonensis]QLB12760.1 lipopolysaccharide ABC transporter permease LptG [Bisgaardia hudsonensis]TCP14310.1 lipopolysaccharide export system permease protein [Bisgaardia hudsonensis]